MPIFHDFHAPGQLPLEVFSANLTDLEAGRSGPGGVRLLDYVIGEHGSLTCVLEARDAAAVYRYHAEQGVPCGPVRPGPPATSRPAP